MKKSLIISTDTFQKYIKEIRKIEVLTHEQETGLFLELKNENLNKTEKKRITDKIVTGNLKFVVTVAREYQNQGLDLMDLIEEGNLGLYSAIEKYEIDYKYKFISYAVWWIRQSIKDALYRHSRTIRIPSNVFQENSRNRNYVNKIDLDTVCDDHDKLLDLDFTDNLLSCISLETKINDDGDILLDVMKNENADNPEDIFETPEEMKKKIKNILGILDERERKILNDYYGLDGFEISLDDIGESLGCTKERVRQIKVNAIKKLRNESYDLIKLI